MPKPPESLLGLTHLIRPSLISALEQHPLAIDATAGNGYDTLFLASTLSQLTTIAPSLLAFEPQASARQNTLERLGALSSQVHLSALGHEALAMPGLLPLLPQLQPDAVGVIMFNLGFLPGSDKTITTKAETTKPALLASLNLLALHGILSVHCYTGIYNDPFELSLVTELFSGLDSKYWRVLCLRQANKSKNIEELWLVEKNKSRGFAHYKGFALDPPKALPLDSTRALTALDPAIG